MLPHECAEKIAADRKHDKSKRQHDGQLPEVLLAVHPQGPDDADRHTLIEHAVFPDV